MLRGEGRLFSDVRGGDVKSGGGHVKILRKVMLGGGGR